VLDQLKIELKQLASAGQFKRFVSYSSKSGAEIQIGGRRLLDFTSWDYLNLNRNRSFKRTAQTAIENVGLSVSSSRLGSGTSENHLILERRIAQFLSTESSVLFSSKNQAVLSLITALLNEKDLVVADELIQSPVSDAAYLVNVPNYTFNAEDPQSLRKELGKQIAAKRKLVFVESVSPVSGLRRDISKISAEARELGAEVIVDESFSLGAIGLRGAGSRDFRGLDEDATAYYADLSLGLSSFGAAIAGSNTLIEYIINRSRTFTSESPLPPALALAAEKALDIVELSTAHRERIATQAATLRDGMITLGAKPYDSKDVPIVCLPISKNKQAIELCKALQEKGILVDKVKKGLPFSDMAIVRLIVNSEHTDLHVSQFLQAFSEVWPRLEKA